MWQSIPIGLLQDGDGVASPGRPFPGGVGRPGKDASGKAKTREAKLGCVFTQTRLDAKGRPVRDEDSTTYVGAIEPAEAFGRRLYAEVVRRGIHRAALEAPVGRDLGDHGAEVVSKLLAHLDSLEEGIETLSAQVEEVIAPFAAEVARLERCPVPFT